MKNAIFTWASGTEFCQSEGFQVFFETLRNVDAEVVFFTHSMPDAVQIKIKDAGHLINKVNPHEVKYPIGDRHLHYWKYMCHHEYHMVMHTDCRDVVFQSDPFALIAADTLVTLVDEGMPPTASGFHLIEQFEFQKGLPPKEPRHFPILNGGTIIGAHCEMASLFLAIWSIHIRVSPRVTDQAALNYLYHILKEHPGYRVSNPKAENLCLTGEGMKECFVNSNFRDGIFYHSESNEPYSIVHQWDRTRFKKDVLSHYLE